MSWLSLLIVVIIGVVILKFGIKLILFLIGFLLKNIIWVVIVLLIIGLLL